MNGKREVVPVFRGFGIVVIGCASFIYRVRRKFLIVNLITRFSSDQKCPFWVAVKSTSPYRPLLGESCRANIANATVVCALIHKFLPLHIAQFFVSAMFSPLSYRNFLKVLAVTEVKTVPYVPLSHPFFED